MNSKVNKYDFPANDYDLDVAIAVYDALKRAERRRFITNHLIIACGVPTIVLSIISQAVPVWLILSGLIIGLVIVRGLERDVSDRLLNYLIYTRQPIPGWLKRQTFFTRPTTIRRPSTHFHREKDEHNHT